MNDIIKNEWYKLKFRDYLSEFPKSKNPSGISHQNGPFKFYVCSQNIFKSFKSEMNEEAILLSTGGEASIHFATGKYSYSTDVWAIKSSGALINSFAYRCLEFRLKQINYAGFQGSGIRHLDKEFIKKLEFLVPTVSEQKKIASILTSVDDVIEKTQSQINKLQDLKKGMINKFLTKGIDHKEFKDSELGMIPRSWELIPLSQIANKKDPFSFAGGPFGSNLKTEHYCDSGIRIIQLQNIGDGEFLDNYEIFTSKEKANELLSCNIFPDDIIISKMGDPVARACIIPNLETRYLMASDGIRLSVNKNEFDVNFILETINHHRFRSEAERISIGSTRKRISLTELRTLIIAHPSLKEQKEISSFIHSINLSIKKKKQKLFKVQCLKKSLMQDLLTGKVRVSIN
jgi:type I restriction enzyme S subunit